MHMHASKCRKVEEEEAKHETENKLSEDRDTQSSCPWQTVRSHQTEADNPWRIETQGQGRGGRRGGLQRLPRFGSLFWQLTVLWLHLTLSMSSGNSVLSWPRLPLMDLDSLRLLFFCSSIQRSSEHFRCCRRRPPSRPASIQQPVLSPPRTTETFPSPFASNSFLVLDRLAGRSSFSVPFWVQLTG